MNVRLTEVDLPDFGVPQVEPVPSAADFAKRFDAFDVARRAAGLDAVVIYADREHCANFHWLTGFDPRFEEALLIVSSRKNTILTGPENAGRARAAKLPADVIVYPPLGLLGLDRKNTPRLADLYAGAGLAAGMTVGVIGWKYFSAAESEVPEEWIEAPAYVVDTLRRFVSKGRVVNATALMMHATNGLRCVNEISQIAQYEFAATHASEAVKRVLMGIRPGIREYDAATLLRPTGLAQSCHPAVNSGPRAAGLVGPTDRVIERGDQVLVGYGVWGALCGKVGWMAEDRSDMPSQSADYVERIAAPYFTCSVEWHETIGIGVSGGLLDAQVRRRLDNSLFKLVLNPGHLIGIEEWLNTPIYPGSQECLRSGQLIQSDIIAAVEKPYVTTIMEDGIALLDAAGRQELAERYPDASRRIDERRRFMSDVVGMKLKPEVMPLSNLCGVFAPYLLNPKRILVATRQTG